jgi:hypothetical protein
MDPPVTVMCYLHCDVNQLIVLIVNLWIGLYLKY